MIKKIFRNPAATASIILEKDGKICLIKRKRYPYARKFALPGGFLNYKRETLKHTAKRELREETNYRVKLKDLKLFEINSEPKRDPRDHVIDHIYIAKKFAGQGKADDDADELYWVALKKAAKMNLAFDHKKVIKHYLKKRK